MSTPPVPPTSPAPAGSTATDGSVKGPSIKLTLESGETTVDDKLSLEVDLASYGAMRRLTAAMGRHINTRLPRDTRPDAQRVHLFFLDSALRSALDISATFEVQVSNIKEAYAGARATAKAALDGLGAPGRAEVRRARSFSVMGGLSSGAAVADAAVALIGALRTDTRYSGRQVVIPEQAFALALAHEWEGDPVVEFHYPTLFIPPTAERDMLMRDVVNAFDAAIEERNAASQALSSLLTRVSQLKQDAPEFLAAKPALDTARDQFQAAEAVFDSLSTQLTKADEKTGLTQMQLLERAAFARKIADAAPERTFYVFAQVVAAGGAFRIKKNFIRMLVGRDGLEHAGGCIATFGLFNAAGRLIASDTIGGRSAYQGSRPEIDLR